MIEVNVARQRAFDERAGAAEVERLRVLAIRNAEKEARERAREELAAEILSKNASLTKGEGEVEHKRKIALNKNTRPKPPPGLLGMDKWGNKIERK